jgi:hypothetical protein
LYDAHEQVTTSGAAGSGDVDALTQLALDLDRQHNLKFTGNYYQDLVGLGEKWLKGDDGWYFIKPDGGVYRWSGTIDNSQLVGALDASYHTDPRKLHDATSR